MAGKKALITGITGQDGSYLAELLLEKGYEVHGMLRRSSTTGTERIDHLCEEPPSIHLHHGDLTDASRIDELVDTIAPDEIYNLGAQSHVKVSWDEAEYTANVVGLGPLRLLEAIRRHRTRSGRSIRFYQASSSEMFGSAPPPQSRETPFHPRSPYAVAKVSAFWQTINHRESYGIFGCNGILFNHESPRRGETFVTRKITRAVGRIKMGLQDSLSLGNLDARRDWGHARDYVEAMHLMLQLEEPRDLVIATGEAHTVQEFAEAAFGCVDLDFRDYVRVDPRFFRPAEVNFLQGDAREAFEVLNWRPSRSFKQLVEEMVQHDLELARQEKILIDSGSLASLKGIGAQ